MFCFWLFSEIWPDLGSLDNGEMSTEDQFVALKEIFLAELPGEYKPPNQNSA
jgi:hypothetical protein